MSKLGILLLQAILLSVTVSVSAQFSRSDAIDLVKNQLLSSELADIDIYASLDVMTGQSGLLLAYQQTIQYPYDSNWVFFIDNMPYANWHHSCRYIFVNSETGEYSIVSDKTIFPDGWQTQYEAVSLMPRPQPTQIQWPEYPDNPVSGLAPNPHLYAVIICGSISDQHNFWNDISAIYTALIQVYGYKKENIFVHYMHGHAPYHGDDLDGDGMNDINYYACHDSIEKTFRNLSGDSCNNNSQIPKLEADDQLLVYVDCHGDFDGSHSLINLIWDPTTMILQDLYDFELAEWLEKMHCAQIVCFMEQCYSGGFIDDITDYTNNDVLCRNRTIHTACSGDEPSIVEWWISQYTPLGPGTYNEFAFYWIAAARGFYPTKEHPYVQGYPTGQFPFNIIPGFSNHPADYDPDTSGDGFVTMDEAFQYADNFDTWSPEGYYNNALPPGPYFTAIEHPQKNQNLYPVGFVEDLQSLCGLTGKIEASEAPPARNYMIGGDLIINQPATLTIASNSNLYLGSEIGKITVDPGAYLNVGNGVLFAGGDNSSVEINGGINELINVTFANDLPDPFFKGVYLNNENLQPILNNVHFIKTGLHNYGNSFTIKNNSNFTNCNRIDSHGSDVDIKNSEFFGSSLDLDIPQPGPDEKIAIIENNIFNGANAIDFEINISQYDQFSIRNNNILNTYTGIGIYHSGMGTTGNQNIYNNQISSCETGIIGFNTTATIERNHIFNNLFGVKFYDNSNISLIGNVEATINSETQEIWDNESYEVYASDYSFPYRFRYNAIIDADNLGNPADPLVYNDNNYLPLNYRIDIQYNCWGPNFNPEQDLYTRHGIFKYLPMWCPFNGGGIADVDEDLFNQAEIQFDSGNYYTSKDLFQSLVNQYPASKFSQSALRELYRLEKYAGNDYSSLKEYFISNDTINSDTILTNLAGFYANNCNIPLENWIEAISWYENKIQNAQNEEDSICSIIDLEHTYLLMENSGLKYTYTGLLPQYKPESKEKYGEYRDYLLSLLPGKDKYETLVGKINKLKYGELLQNVPNPFSMTSDIYFRLSTSGTVKIKVTDHFGKLQKEIRIADTFEGIHKVELSSSGLQNGLYYYSLEIDGLITDTKKMIVIRD